MGRTPKFPPLPPKDGTDMALTILPRALTPESEASRKREIALLTRAKLDDNFDAIVDQIMQLDPIVHRLTKTGDVVPILDLEVHRLKLDTLKWLADRGYGKAPQIVKVGSDEGTPQALLEQIAKKRMEALTEKLEADRIRAEAVTTEVEKENP